MTKALRKACVYLIASYAICGIIVIVVVLSNLNTIFRVDPGYIDKDIVSFNSFETADINNAVASQHKPTHFKHIYEIENTPSAPNDGLKGILYDFGEACGEKTNFIPKTPFIVSNKNVTRIALIKRTSNCYLLDKIIRAEIDGAHGVIVYDTNVNVSRNHVLGVSPKTVTIPVLHATGNVGSELLLNLSTFYKQSNLTEYGFSEYMVQVILHPSTKPILNRWEFALTIIFGMFLVGFIHLCVYQFYKYRLAKKAQRRRQDNVEVALTADEQRQLMIEERFWRENVSGEVPAPSSPIKYRLDQLFVDLLPTRVYLNKNNVDEESPKELESMEDLGNCVICIESFENGDILRRLPCCHEYHRDCIDVWLTRRCASCPLCNAMVDVPEEDLSEALERHTDSYTGSTISFN